MCIYACDHESMATMPCFLPHELVAVASERPAFLSQEHSDSVLLHLIHAFLNLLAFVLLFER